MTATKCLSCKQPRHPRQYLCWPCWKRLPEAAQTALFKRDAQAGARLIELAHQLADGVSLGEIEVTP